MASCNFCYVCFHWHAVLGLFYYFQYFSFFKNSVKEKLLFWQRTYIIHTLTYGHNISSLEVNDRKRILKCTL